MNRCIYIKNKNTGDYIVIQPDGSSIMCNPKNRTICNPPNYHYFMGLSEFNEFRKTIDSRNNLEEIDLKLFHEKLNLTWLLILKVTGELNPVTDNLERNRIMINIEQSNDYKF